ncbi:MAG TPA: sulfotransferase, partial [Candidatus Obscuribacterales bacterium]
ARLAALRDRGKFADTFAAVESYCTFIGYSRSGHSLIAALLDAHPNIVMAHELRAIKYVKANFSRDSLYYLLFQNTHIRGHSWKRGSGYTYNVPGQWQGAFEKINVIGDKHGEYTVNELAANPKLINKLRQTVGVPIKLIHVIRNPFDNIATMALKKAKNGAPLDLDRAIKRYFHTCASVMQVKTLAQAVEVFDLSHESFVKAPRSHLQELCLWLGVQSSEDYLNACADIVFDSPNKSRHKVDWSEAQKQAVMDGISGVPFLQEYCFDS